MRRDLGEVDAFAARIEEKQAERDNLATEQKLLDQQVTEIQTGLDDTQARVRELESGTGEQQRRIREQEIQKEILTINAKGKGIETGARSATTRQWAEFSRFGSPKDWTCAANRASMGARDTPP